MSHWEQRTRAQRNQALAVGVRRLHRTTRTPAHVVGRLLLRVDVVVEEAERSAIAEVLAARIARRRDEVLHDRLDAEGEKSYG